MDAGDEGGRRKMSTQPDSGVSVTREAMAARKREPRAQEEGQAAPPEYSRCGELLIVRKKSSKEGSQRG